MTTPFPRPGAPRPGRRPPARLRWTTRAPSSWTPRSGSAGTARPSSPGASSRRWSASTATPRRCVWRGSGSRRSATGSPRSTRRTTAIPDVLRDLGLAHADGVLFDLGVSSMQLDVADRGFAYREDAPLDMRMDPTDRPTAADVLNTYPRAELARVLREYGEERFAPRIAAAIVRERTAQPFATSAPAGRAALRPDPRARPAYRRTSGEADVPGAADGGQRRARRAASRDPGRHRLAGRRRPRRRRVLPLARGPAGQAGVRRRHHGSTSRPTCRSSRPTGSRRSGWSPAAPSAPTTTRSPTTPAPPRSGCAPSNGSARRALGAAHEAREQPDMSSTAPALRARVPRLAERRPRARAAHRRPEAEASPDQPGAVPRSWCRCSRSAASSGFCSSTPRCSRRRSRPPTCSSQADTLEARQQSLQMELDRLRDPQAIALKAQRMGMVLPDQPRRPRPAQREGARCTRPRRRGSTRCGCCAPPPAKPAELNPPAHVTVVQPPSSQHTRPELVGQHDAPFARPRGSRR